MAECHDCTEASGGGGGVQVFPERTPTDLGFQGLLVAGIKRYVKADLDGKII